MTGSWRTIARGKTDHGWYGFDAVKTPAAVGTTSFRAVAPSVKTAKGKIYSRIATTPRTTTIQPNLYRAQTVAKNEWQRWATDVTVDGRGNVYFACECNTWSGPGKSTYKTNGPRILRVSPSGQETVVAGSGKERRPIAGPATASPLRAINSLAADSDGNLYASMNEDAKGYGRPLIVRISSDGMLSVVAGDGEYGPYFTDGPSTENSLPLLDGMAVGPDGNLILAFDEETEIDGKKRIRSHVARLDVGAKELRETLTLSCGSRQSHYRGDAVAVDGQGTLYWAGRCGGDQLERIDAAGKVDLLAGDPARSGEPRPGQGTQSRLLPWSLGGITVDRQGTVYLPDYSDLVRITADGRLSNAVIPGPKFHEIGPVEPSVAAAPDGSVYVLGDTRLLRVTVRD